MYKIGTILQFLRKSFYFVNFLTPMICLYKADKDNPVIIFDDFTTSYHWVDFNFKVKSSAMKILKPKKYFIGVFRYIFYAMNEIKYQPKEHSRQWNVWYRTRGCFYCSDSI